MNKNIHTISTKPGNAEKYSYMPNYNQPFSHKSKKCQDRQLNGVRKCDGQTNRQTDTHAYGHFDL